MNSIKLGRKEFEDKVSACWLGKNIGGTLGASWECKRHTHNLTYYQPVPDQAVRLRAPAKSECSTHAYRPF